MYTDIRQVLFQNSFGKVVFRGGVQCTNGSYVIIFLLKNRLAYLNSNAIFEFLGQFTIRCISFQKGVDNFEMEHKTC